MLKRIALALALLAPLPALAQQPPAPDVSLTLSAQEAQTVASILDGQIKAGGYQAARQIVPILDKLVAASQAAAKPAQEPAK